MSENSTKGLNKPIAKYHSYETFPARVFFDVRESKDYQLMRPKPKADTQELKRIYDAVYDRYFVELDSREGKRYLELRGIIASGIYVKSTITNVLGLIWSIPAQMWNHAEVIKERREILESLNILLDTPIDFESDLLDEISRVLNVERGMITDSITEAEAEMEQMQKENQKQVFNFYSELQGLENMHGRTLDEKMSLPMFVANVKSAVEKSNILKQQQLNGK